jgi:DNA processing protein
MKKKKGEFDMYKMNLILVYFAKKYDGDWDKIFQAINKKELVPNEELETLQQNLDCKYVTLIDSNYPEHFKSKYKPPFVLFYTNVEPTEENTYELDYGKGAYDLDLELGIK